jgi:hypothetical protein
MTFAPFQAAGSRCLGTQVGASRLMAYIVNERRDGARNWGIYACRRIAGTTRVSVHSEGRALDIGFSGVSNPAGTRLVNALLPHVGKLGIQVIIWNRRIWSRANPRGATYRGASPHTDHVHIELGWPAARGLTTATIRAVMRGASVPTAPSNRPAKPNATAVINAWRAGRTGRWINLVPVRALQTRLRQVGQNPGVVDGKYGAQTRSAVLAYQRRFTALANDGIAGAQTINHLWR